MVSYGRYAGQQVLGAGIRGAANYAGYRARRRFPGKKRGGANKFRRGLDRRNVGNYKFKALQEKKYHDVALSHAAASAQGTIGADAGPQAGTILAIAQGTAEQQRIGRKITITNINIRGNFTLPPGATFSSDMGRLIIYLDKQCNGATAAVTDIIKTNTVNECYRDFLNLSNSGRFVILQDLYFTMNSSCNDATINQFGEINKTHKYNKRCSIPIEYSSTAGAITEIKSNNICTLFVNHNAQIEYTADVRIRFTDS